MGVKDLHVRLFLLPTNPCRLPGPCLHPISYRLWQPFYSGGSGGRGLAHSANGRAPLFILRGTSVVSLLHTFGRHLLIIHHVPNTVPVSQSMCSRTWAGQDINRCVLEKLPLWLVGSKKTYRSDCRTSHTIYDTPGNTAPGCHLPEWSQYFLMAKTFLDIYLTEHVTKPLFHGTNLGKYYIPGVKL